MKVFLDTNVLLDVLCRSGRPSAEASCQILQAIRSGRMEGVITTQSIVDAAFILSRGNVQQPFLQAIETLLRFVNVRPIDAMDIRDALLHPTGDFDAAYAVLEIEPTATDDEVRAAYKRMVVKHHPDRVASLGEDIKAAAEKKMREINEAKELIYKARGL